MAKLSKKDKIIGGFLLTIGTIPLVLMIIYIVLLFL